LHHKNRVFDKAAIPANLLILRFSLADITLVLDFDEIDLNDDSTDLDNMPDKIISVDGFKQRQGCICLKVTNLVLNLSNYLKTLWIV
jgi:hypothetical protein